MSDTTAASAAPTQNSPRGALSTMRLDELKQLAGSMGIPGISKMRKSDLVTAIRAKRAEAKGVASRTSETLNVTAPSARAAAETNQDSADAAAPQSASQASEQKSEQTSGAQDEQSAAGQKPARRGRQASAAVTDTSAPSSTQDDAAQASREDNRREAREEQNSENSEHQSDASDGDARESGRSRGERGGRRGRGGRENRDENATDTSADGNRNDRQDRNDKGDKSEQRNDRNEQRGQDKSDKNERNDRNDRGERNDRRHNRNNDDDERGGRRRRQRGRDRDRNKRGRGRDFEDEAPEIREDDVLVPVAGIVDVLDNYAFVRTTGYLSGPTDVYVPMGMVKKNGLRKGDAVTGAIRALREGEQLPARQKFNALVRLDSVNGMSVDDAKKRVDFNKLTPLYPQERLRLETTPNVLTTRIIDLVAPIGKGQRGLIVAPAKAGKTMVMQSVANAITTNNPECHLMVVLVDERPEEVTDMQRAVKGEVIASTFDRPATDHTTVAELAIERAKRLVELGHDVVVLLDSITKLGRAYNLAAPASGRILSGGVDSAALYPPKKFFGAARNIENGGSLTILATALVETGSKMDEVIFEEFKGTGNMELKLDRQLANRRIFPAVDVNASGTRREEILLSGEELKIMWKLRRVLAALDTQQGVELLIDRLKKTKSNVEFLMQVQQTSSIKLDDDQD